MSDKFDKIIPHILLNEGGYVNNPKDPGGETNFGISKRSYPDLDIKNITAEIAKQIYKRDYWDKYNLERINNFNLCRKVFDATVNMGNKQAIKLLQEAHGVLKVDGIMGTITTGEINSYKNPEDLLNKYRTKIADFYKALAKKNSNYEVFLKGWLTRAAQ